MSRDENRSPRTARLEVYLRLAFQVPGPPAPPREQRQYLPNPYPVPGCTCDAAYATDPEAHAQACPARLAALAEEARTAGYAEYLPSLRDAPAGGCRQCRGNGPLTRDGLCAYCDELAFLAGDRTPPRSRKPEPARLLGQAAVPAAAVLALILVLLAIALATA